MRIIKPSAQVLKHNVPPYEFIERVGRTCYKSEDKITDGSAVKFVENLAKRKHYAMLEHETLFFVSPYMYVREFVTDMLRDGIDLKYFNISLNEDREASVVSGSFRSFIDLFNQVGHFHRHATVTLMASELQKAYPNLFSYLEVTVSTDFGNFISREKFIELFKDAPEIISKHLTHTVKFVCDRGVSHELVRHRPCSFAQESTRYCNYNKEGEIVVIEPFFFTADGVSVSTDQWAERYGAWRYACEEAEKMYLRIIADGGTPQEARSVLPNSLKTEIIVTATENEWQHIINLRYIGTTGAPHPQMKEVMAYAVNDLVRESEGRLQYE